MTAAADTASRLHSLLRKAAAPLEAEGLPLGVSASKPSTQDRLTCQAWIEEEGSLAAVARRTAHATEGEDAPSCRVDFGIHDDEEAERILRGWLHDVATLLREDAAIAAAGHDPAHAPARFHRAHPVLVDALAAWGWDPEEACRPTTIMAHRGLVAARSEDGIYTDLLSRELERHRVSLTRRLVRRRVVVDSLSILPLTGRTQAAPGILYSDRDGMPTVSVTPLILPETVLSDLAGRKVGDVVAGGPADVLLHHVIEEAWTSGGNTTVLRIGDDERAVA